uniref:Uncharacterized protein n=1 Tax=Anguilla anguilla TaxID=7936 RepID=A0A0E9SR32_ANGAN
MTHLLDLIILNKSPSNSNPTVILETIYINSRVYVTFWQAHFNLF